jgi:hypothetical protein
MANKTLFASLRDALIPQTDTVNSENAPAYALAPKQALAQYAATGCFGRTFYATAGEQLTRVLELCDAVDREFVARLAIYSRTQSFMKDMPALLCAWLSAHDPRLHEAVFARVVDMRAWCGPTFRFFAPEWPAGSRWGLLPSGWCASGSPAATRTLCSTPARVRARRWRIS